jgi:hypothetical protein
MKQNEAALDLVALLEGVCSGLQSIQNETKRLFRLL